MIHALTREVAASLGDCQLSFVERTAIDVALARRQHSAYQEALRSLGCEIVALPALDAYPDSVFVEDVALVFPEVAVLTRPGAPSRRGEVDSVGAALASFRELRRIEAPGTIDGGDVLRLGRNVYVGLSARSNPEGIAQLGSLLAPFGYLVEGLPVRGCLHLKSAVTALADEVVLIQPEWIDPGLFAAYERIEIDPAEPHAANILRVGSGFVYPANFPRTAAKLERAGYAPTRVEVSELQKAEGAVTCCSLVFSGP